MSPNAVCAAVSQASIVSDLSPHRILRESMIVALANLFARRLGSFASLPVPSGTSTIVIDGPDPDRILLAGSGVVIGYGTTSHALGIGGCLARFVAAGAERGVMLDIVPIDALLARFAPAHLTRIDLGGYAAVVLAVGVNDAFGMTFRNSWRRSLAATLNLFRDRMRPGSQVFVIAIADKTSSPLFHSGPSRRARSRGLALNQETEWAVASEPNVTMIELQMGDGFDKIQLYGASSYQRWARQLSPHVIEGLARGRSTG